MDVAQNASVLDALFTFFFFFFVIIVIIMSIY